MRLHEHAVGAVITLARRPVELDVDNEYREIGIRSFGRGVFHKAPVRGDEIGDKKVFLIFPGDLLFSNVFAWEGAVALAADSEKGMIGSHRFMTYQVNESIADGRYLSYYFSSGPGIDLIRAASPGSAGRNRTLGIKSFAAQTVRIPDKTEQRRIADRLDALFKRVDGVRELRARSSSVLTSLAESLIDEVTANARTIGRVGDIVSLDRTPIAIDSQASYRVIGVRSFGKGVIRYPSALGDDVSRLSYFTLPANALLLSNIKAWEGAISVTTETIANDYVASNRFLTYMPNDERTNISYLRHYFLSRRGLAQISAASPGGADRNRTLGRKRFEALEIPLPPRAEQDRVARILDALAERVSKVHAAPELDSLRPSILNAAFTGRL